MNRAYSLGMLWGLVAFLSLLWVTSAHAQEGYGEEKQVAIFGVSVAQGSCEDARAASQADAKAQCRIMARAAGCQVSDLDSLSCQFTQAGGRPSCSAVVSCDCHLLGCSRYSFCLRPNGDESELHPINLESLAKVNQCPDFVRLAPIQ